MTLFLFFFNYCVIIAMPAHLQHKERLITVLMPAAAEIGVVAKK